MNVGAAPRRQGARDQRARQEQAAGRRRQPQREPGAVVREEARKHEQRRGRNEKGKASHRVDWSQSAVSR